MSPETIGAIFTGLTGLVAALAAYAANHGRRNAADLRALRRRVRRLEQFAASAVGHIFNLELVLSSRGFPVPSRPEILENFYAEEDDSESAERPGHDRA